MSSSSSPTDSDAEQCISELGDDDDDQEVGNTSGDEDRSSSDSEVTETASENEVDEDNDDDDEALNSSSSSLSTSIAAAVGSTSALSSSEDDEEEEDEVDDKDDDDDDDDVSSRKSHSVSDDEDAEKVDAQADDQEEAGHDQVDYQVTATARPQRPGKTRSISSSKQARSEQGSKKHRRPHTGGTARSAGRKSSAKYSHGRKLSGSSNSSKRTAISASAPTVASVDPSDLSAEQQQQQQQVMMSSKSSRLESTANLSVSSSLLVETSGVDKGFSDSTKSEKIYSFSKLSDAEAKSLGLSSGGGVVLRSGRPASLCDPHSSSELEDSGEESSKKLNRLNLFTNFSNNVKTKSATMIRKLQRPFDGGSSNRSSTTELPPRGSAPPPPPESKMKTALKTLPLVKQLKHQLDKSKTKKKLAKSRLSASATPSLMSANELNAANLASTAGAASTASANAASASASASSVPRITIFEDEHCFQLPHQHYYWNQYYQQLDKFQRRELLKELDRVMHLLITNIGVEFIWSKLAQIFQVATEEAVSLKRLLRLIIKNVRQVDLTTTMLYGSSDEEEDSEEGGSSFDDDDHNSEEMDDENDDDEYNRRARHSSDSDDPDFDPTNEGGEGGGGDTDADSASIDSSLSWAKSLTSSLLAEFITECQQQLRAEQHYSERSLGVNLRGGPKAEGGHRGGGGGVKKPRAASSLSSHSCSSSSSPIHFRRATLPASFATEAVATSGAHYHHHQHHHQQHRRLRSNSTKTPRNSSVLLPTTQLKQKLLCGLSGRCRSCHAALPFVSPVQPVGSDSVTVLEACTLVRFLLGDSRPFNHPNIGVGGVGGSLLSEQGEQFAGSMAGASSAFFSSSNISNTLMGNSVSASINRCSALEPLAVETSNYHFLIQFLDQALKQMSARAKSFAPVDLRASVELCLALCAKLKPAIMQTFVQRYRQSLNESLRANALGTEVGGGSESRRKTSIGAWFAGSVERNVAAAAAVAAATAKKTRSSSTASSSAKKQLEQVKEEDEEHEEDSGSNAVPPAVKGQLKMLFLLALLSFSLFYRQQ